MLLSPPQTTAQSAVRKWNADHPVGTPVLAMFRGKQVRTRTSSAAWSFNNSALVSCRHLSSAVQLSEIRVRFECWVWIQRSGHTCRWLQTQWDTREECVKSCEFTKQSDKRVSDYEIRETEPADYSVR